MVEKTRVIDAIERLSDLEVEQVNDFIESLRRSRPTPPVGSIEAARRTVGTWWMQPDDTDRFLNEVDHLRHLEDADCAIPPQY